MYFEALKDTLESKPFPFRLTLSNGKSFEVKHPELINLTRRTVSIAVVPQGKDTAEYHSVIATERITDVEPVSDKG